MESSKNFTMNLGEKIMSEFCTVDFEFRCSRRCYRRGVKRKRMPSRASRKARTPTGLMMWYVRWCVVCVAVGKGEKAGAVLRGGRKREVEREEEEFAVSAARDEEEGGKTEQRKGKRGAPTGKKSKKRQFKVREIENLLFEIDISAG